MNILQQVEIKFWQLKLFAALIIAGTTITCFLKAASAQIVPDNTLGNENSIVTPNTNVRGLPATLIEGGATRGVNLFQSFLQFNVGNDQRVYFANPTGIENILTRVTGNNPSNIFGTLGVNGNANLFLLNPNGIIFGQNASLDVAGSFFATTANSFLFENGMKFSATNPEVPHLLMINVPIGVQLTTSSGTISNSGILNVGQDLTLAGRNLNLQGQLYAGKDLTLQAEDTVTIRDSGESPFIASAGRNLTIQGNQVVDIFALNNLNSGLFSIGNMVLRSSNTVRGDAHYLTAGNFRIENLDGSLGDLFSPNAPLIFANGDVYFNSYQGASLRILAGGTVEIPGYIWIQNSGTFSDSLAETVTLSNGTTISIDGSAEPTLDIRAGITTFATPSSVLVSPISADIKLGTILFADSSLTMPLAGKILLTNQYQPNDSLTGNIEISATQGGIFTNRAIVNGDFFRGGDVNLDSRGDIKVSGIINTDAVLFNGNYFGNGGNVSLLANRDITLSSGSGINSTGLLGGNITLNSGRNILGIGINSFIENKNYTTETGFQGADIYITAAESVSFNNTRLQTNTFGQANSGNIIISSSSILLSNGTQLQTQSTGKGNAGDVILFAIQGNIALDNAEINTTASDPEASAGDIVISASEQISLTNKSEISSNGFFGRIFLGANLDNSSSLPIPNSINIDNSTLSTTNTGTGLAGDIVLNAREQISLTNNSEISSDGNRGRIFLGANPNNSSPIPNRININNSIVSTTNTGTGFAGDIVLNAREQISLTNNSRIFSDGNFGRIFLGANRNNSSLIPNRININNSTISTTNTGTEDAGDIVLNAREQISLTNNSRIFSDGRFGRIFIGDNDEYPQTSSPQNVSFDSSFITTSNSSVINAQNQQINSGNISVNALENISLRNSRIETSTNRQGNAGQVNIESENGDISLTLGSIIFNNVELGGIGNAGQVNITAKNFILSDDSQIQSLVRNGGQGNAGNITVNASEQIFLTNSLISSDGNSQGNAGNIAINAREQIFLTNSFISSEGNFGRIFLGANLNNSSLIPNSINIDNSIVSTTNTGTEDAGDIVLNARGSLTVSNGSQLRSDTVGEGNGGNITINVDDAVNVTNGAFLASNTFGQGNGGNITINAGGAVTFDGLLRDEDGNPIIDENNNVISSGASTSVGDNLQPELDETRQGGDITIKARSLYLNDFSVLSTATSAQGNAGKISIEVDDFVTLDNISNIRSNVERGGVGIAGDINITARSLTLANGSEIDAAVFREGNGQNGGQGRAGNIEITATDFVDISGVGSVQLPISEATAGFSSGIYASAERGTTATSSQAAGNITITTQDFRLAGGGLVNALTSNTGNGGDITINAKNFTATSGGQVITTTRGAGQAGNIKLNVSEEITISGSDPTYNQRLQAAAIFGEPTDIVNNQGANSGIFANTAPNSTGQGGNINIDPILTVVENGGAIAANSQGTGRAGNITLQSNRLILNNGNITTTTTSTDGGNIILNLQDLLILRNGSQISATAGTQNAGGNGGNITINIPQGFIVASPFENSDITANAFTGNGGQVNITTRGIFGIQTREQLSNSSDITASSEFGSSGAILLNTQEVDPANALTSLPENLVDPSNKIDQGCTAFNDQQVSEFKITGRGGLPPSPDQPLNSNSVWEDTRILSAKPQKLVSPTAVITPQSQENKNQIILATGWVFNQNDEVTLISSTPKTTPEKFGSTPQSCPSH